MNALWLVPVVSAGLVGSVHCVGMCGGLVAMAGGNGASWRERASGQLSYQAGRLLSYAALGAAAGALGQAVDLAGEAAGLGRLAALLAGSLMVLWGLSSMLGAVGVRPRWLRDVALPRAVTSWLGRAGARPVAQRGVLLGAASALLPCGFLYGFALAAAASGGAAQGALVLCALWLGNLPALLGFGLALGGALSRLRRHLKLLGSFAVLVLGLYTLSQRINVPALAAFAVTPVPGQGQASALMPADCPFHREREP